MPLILAGTDGNLYQIAIDDAGAFGITQVFGVTPSTYLIVDPLTGTTYLLSGVDLTSTAPNSQGIVYAPAYNLGRGLTYALISPSGYVFNFGVLYGQLASWQGALLTPAINYPSGGANWLYFTRFPVRVPATVGTSGSVASYRARRVQKVFSSGAAEVNFRPCGPASGPGVDQFWRAVMERIAYADLAAWQTFKLYSLAAGQLVGGNAIAGDGSFDLYYTQSSLNHDRYVDDDTRWRTVPMKLGGKDVPFYTFPLNFRLWVAP